MQNTNNQVQTAKIQMQTANIWNANCQNLVASRQD